MSRKIVADLRVRAIAGIWFVLLFAGAFAFVPAATQTLAAFYLVRRDKRWSPRVMPYLELTVPGWFLLGMPMLLIAYAPSPSLLYWGMAAMGIAWVLTRIRRLRYARWWTLGVVMLSWAITGLIAYRSLKTDFFYAAAQGLSYGFTLTILTITTSAAWCTYFGILGVVRGWHWTTRYWLYAALAHAGMVVNFYVFSLVATFDGPGPLVFLSLLGTPIYVSLLLGWWWNRRPALPLPA